MSSKTSSALASAVHPPVGTLIDGGSLELVEVLGVGGYGVVYRAVDARQPSGPKSYAVKCLVASGHQTPRQRQVHIREIALHQIASAHPGVVTLHRVVEHLNHTYIIMDYAPDHDLFTQILHSCRYLGDDGLIKDVFLQLLDAVEYCHSLGIYHRDLKPENILCFDDGLRVAVTDFGLATTDKLSDEFRTGSVYHMSPECQGGDFAPTGNYSPMFNDIWSLGIILLNLATGRNPWKSATPGDPTFQAYLRDPMGFLPTVLPISPEVNEILVRMLEVDWRERMTLREVRYAIEDISSFYSDGVVFEGSMARCPWESGMDIDSASSGTSPDEIPPHSPPTQSSYTEDVNTRLVSHWSKDSSSDIVFATQSLAAESSYGGGLWTTYSSCGATWAFESPVSSDSEHDHFQMDFFDRSGTSSATQSPESSLPPTPNNIDMTFGSRIAKPDVRSLMINTNITRPRIYDADGSMAETYSTGTSMMHTAIEYDPYSSMFFLNSPITDGKGVVIMPDSAITAVGEDKEMTSPTIYTSSSATEMSSPSYYSESSSSNSSLGGDLHFTRSTTPSPEPLHWTMFRSTQVQSPPAQQCQLSSSVSTSMTDVLPPSRLPRTVFTPFKAYQQDAIPHTAPGNNVNFNGTTKPKALSRFAIKFFPRSSSPTPPPTTPASAVSHGRNAADSPYSAFPRRETPPPTAEQAAWNSSPLATQTAAVQQQEGGRGRASSSAHQQPAQLRSPRSHWFLPGRFRAASVVN
ncbi:kinase-like domain-containing protein [Crassisporium funariophilum]|nr:kinase-like domain-containing protein [Crassisporium funariophilum]